MGDKMPAIKVIKQALFLLFMFLGVLIALYGIFKMQLNFSNKEITKYLLESGNPYINTKLNMAKKITSFFSGFDLDNPITILKYNLILKQDNLALLKKQTAYIEDPKYLFVDKPSVYIHNTNQLENYKSDKQSIKPNVLMASYYLRDQLQKFDIGTIVENTDFTSYYTDNLDINIIYKVVEPTIKDRLIKYSDYLLLIDISRDVGGYKKTTLNYDNKNMAKLQFLVKKDNSKSIALAQILSDYLNKLVPDLSLGLIYNSDDITANLSLSDKMVIIKCGGVDNSFEEIQLSLSFLAQAIDKYLGETYGKI